MLERKSHRNNGKSKVFMDMQEHARIIGKKLIELLDKHDSIIFLHNSLKYKIDDALKTFSYDDSAITAMMLLQDHLNTLSSEGHIKISAFANKPDLVQSFSSDYENINSCIRDSKINDQIDDMAESIRRYFYNLPCGVTNELNALLNNKRTVADIYTKSLKSLKDFQRFMFVKPNGETDSKKLDLFSTIYSWLDYNSLLDQCNTLEDGIYFCFIGHVFNFLIKSNGELTAIADPLEYNSYRNHFGKKFVPYSKNKVDAGYYLPYEIIQHQGGKLNIQAYSSNLDTDFQNQIGRHMICDISDLKISSLVYVVLTYELLINERATLQTNEIPSAHLCQVAERYYMSNAIEHKSNQSLITADQIHYKNFFKKFPDKQHKGLNNRLEDLYGNLVDHKLLNLVKHNDQVFCPDENGCLKPFNEKLTLKKASSWNEQIVKLQAFDLTMIGTNEQLEELRYNVARVNYAALLEMHSQNHMHDQLPKLFKYLEGAINKNMDKLEQLMGFPKLQTVSQHNENKAWYLGVSSIEYPDLVRSAFNMPLKITIASQSPGSSVKRCYKTGSKAFQTFYMRVETVEQLSTLIDVPVSKLPDILQLYKYVNNSHYNLQDPVDLLWDIWEQKLIEIEIVSSKATHNLIKRKTSLHGFESLKVVTS